MKGQLFCVCAVLVVVASFGACYGQSSPNTPEAASAGPCAPVAPTATMPSTGVAVDSSFVYVLQDGKLYKFAKSEINSCGTAVPPPCVPCPSYVGAGPCPTPCPAPCPTPCPAPCPAPCGGMSYIPGNTPSTLTVTTRTPCITPCPAPCPTGAGPASCNPCPTTPPCVPSCGPSSTVSCTNCYPCPCPTVPCPTANCGPCGITTCPQMSYTTTCTTVPAGPGCGPCAIPPIGTPSACAQQTLACLQTLCGADADRAYLQAIVQLNLSVLAVSNAAADHLGTTSLQDYATNSIADSRTSASKAEGWLKTKYLS